MVEGWVTNRIDSLGGSSRPVLKAGPFGAALTKDRYTSAGYKVYGQQEVISRSVEGAGYYIDSDQFKSLKSCEVFPDDILMTMMGTVGEVFKVPQNAPAGLINPRLVRMSFDQAKILSGFAEIALQQGWVKRLLNRRSHGGTMPGLNLEAIASIKLKIPPLNEQLKIAEIVRTWDEALEKLNELAQAKRFSLDYLRMHLLLDDSVVTSKLSNFTEELTQRNLNLAIPRSRVMAVTKAEGVVPMREQTIAADIARYKQVPPQAFAYNPMRINVGSIAKNEHEETVLVSPDYVVFKCLPDLLEPRYLEHLRKTDWWSHYINSGGSGSVRQRTYYSDLAALRPPVPPIERQIEIVNILDAAAKEIALIEQQITAIERQKRGLMQKLLTGEWRVDVGQSQDVNDD